MEFVTARQLPTLLPLPRHTRQAHAIRRPHRVTRIFNIPDGLLQCLFKQAKPCAHMAMQVSLGVSRCVNACVTHGRHVRVRAAQVFCESDTAGFSWGAPRHAATMLSSRMRCGLRVVIGRKYACQAVDGCTELVIVLAGC